MEAMRTKFNDIKNNLKLKVQKILKILMLIIAICTGYPFEMIINAFTISSLIQILIKLFFSLFFIKLSIIVQISLLFLLIPIYVKFNTFAYFRTYLGFFLEKSIPESSFWPLDTEIYDFPEDAIINYNDAWYNHLLLSFIHFFILIRMFLMSEPFLSFLLKFIAIRYFILNEYLFLAYTISLVFILSRFIFLLSDKTLGVWKASIREMLENPEESPKITKKNILIMTHWSLRGLDAWGLHLSREKNLLSLNVAKYLHIPKLKEKFGLEFEKIQTTPKNGYCIKSIIIISFFIFSYPFYQTPGDFFGMNFLALVESLKNTPKLFKIDKFKDNFTFHKNDVYYNKKLLKNLSGHHCLFKVEKKSEYVFLEATTFTSIKDASICTLNGATSYPYSQVYRPEIVLPNGFRQGYASISYKKLLNQRIFTKENNQMYDFLLNSEFNKNNFHNFSFSDMEKLNQKIQKNNIFIFEENLKNLTREENQLIDELCRLQVKFPACIRRALWCFLEKDSFSPAQVQILLGEAFRAISANLDNPQLSSLFFSIKSNLTNPNFYNSPFYQENHKFECILTELHKLNDQQTDTNSKQNLSGCLAFPFVPFQHQDLDDP